MPSHQMSTATRLCYKTRLLGCRETQNRVDANLQESELTSTVFWEREMKHGGITWVVATQMYVPWYELWLVYVVVAYAKSLSLKKNAALQ